MALFDTKPDDVFTPRSAEINPRLYIPRPELESELHEALNESQHIVVFGESGNGKSWLYKRVFAQHKVHFEVVNLVQASRLGSLDAAFRDKIDRLEQLRKDTYDTTKNAKIAPGGIGAEFKGEWSYTIGKKEPFEDLLAYINASSRKQKVIVLDNFEQISANDDICKQVSDCIVLLDDPVYSNYDVKLCIVGVPSGIDEILSKHGNIQTISSRLKEIPEVERMTKREARLLMEIGLERTLGLSILGDSDKFYDEILWITDRIALELQELGLRIAKEARKSGDKIERRAWSVAVRKWSGNSIKSYCAAVAMRMNSRQTKAARRNQCIFAVGNIDKPNFTYRDIEERIRLEFPETTNGVALNVSGELSKLADGANPILKRLPTDDSYRLSSPKFRMAIRALLEKSEDGKIQKTIPEF